MSALDFRSGTITDAPIRNNVVTDQDGTDISPSFVARMTKIWMGWVRELTLWANAQGHSEAHAYSAGDYTHSGGGTWTVDSGDLLNYSWRLSGDTLSLNVYIAHSSIAGFVGTVNVAFPSEAFDFAYYAAETQQFPAIIIQNNVPVAGATAEVVATTSTVLVFDPAAAMAASTNATTVAFSIAFRVVPS